MNDKNNLYILSIVAIFTVIGIVMMVITVSTRSIYNSAISNTDVVGRAVGADSAQVDYPSCTDTDGGQNYDLKGVAVGPDKYGGNDSGVDYCDPSLGPNVLMEAYCDSGYVNYILYDCPNDCSDGACIRSKTPTCTESDGGINYYVRGTIKGTDKYGNPNPGVDYCTYGPNLMEGFCDESGYANFILYPCPHGCKRGACIP
jgi:hypothetical protein